MNKEEYLKMISELDDPYDKIEFRVGQEYGFKDLVVDCKGNKRVDIEKYVFEGKDSKIRIGKRMIIVAFEDDYSISEFEYVGNTNLVRQIGYNLGLNHLTYEEAKEEIVKLVKVETLVAFT